MPTPITITSRLADSIRNRSGIACRHLLCAMLLLLQLPGHSQTGDQTGAQPQWQISDLAADADLVALVQVEQTQYQYRRGFEIDGYADLRIMIPYKQDVASELIRVRESGLRENSCYFSRTFLGDEGPRYLVFLAATENNDAGLREYVGHPMGCKQSVLVSSDHQYVLRYPLEGNVRLADEHAQWIEDFDFSDPAAFAGEPELTPGRKQKLAERVDGVVDERGVKYTRGIHIRHVKDLIGRDNLRRAGRGGKY